MNPRTTKQIVRDARERPGNTEFYITFPRRGGLKIRISGFYNAKEVLCLVSLAEFGMDPVDEAQRMAWVQHRLSLYHYDTSKRIHLGGSAGVERVLQILDKFYGGNIYYN